MCVEKSFHKQESGKNHIMYGFVSILAMPTDVYKLENVRGCLAGHGESWKHVSALLHYTEFEVPLSHNNGGKRQIKGKKFAHLHWKRYFPYLDSNIPKNPTYRIYISQLVRYAKICSDKSEFKTRNKRLSTA